MMMRRFIEKVMRYVDLTENEATDVMNLIMGGEATSAQIGSFLTALKMKGETVEEITGCAKVMKDKAVKIRPKVKTLIDTCGTGGDGANTFNISTTAAFVVAGAGLGVAKHGNRSVSSKSGSADVLESLGIAIDIGPENVEVCVEKVGIGFLFAPVFHRAMMHAAGARKEIGVRTIFNALGPLTNPAGARSQVVGVYQEGLTEVVASALGKLGVERAFVVHGYDGLDEISITGTTKISELRDGRVETYAISPGDLGLERGSINDLIGGSPQENADITLRILSGESGPRRDIVLLNSAAAIVMGGLADTLRDGIDIAAQVVDSGKAMEKLEDLREYTQRCLERPA